MLLFDLLYIIGLATLAYLNALWIGENKKINHYLNGAIFLGLSVASGLIWWKPLIISSLCITRVFFDCFLNVFRRLPLNYISPNPESWIDKLEIKLFGREFYLVKLGYLSVALLLHAVYFIFIH